jgi:hypothetical protein
MPSEVVPIAAASACLIGLVGTFTLPRLSRRASWTAQRRLFPLLVLLVLLGVAGLSVIIVWRLLVTGAIGADSVLLAGGLTGIGWLAKRLVVARYRALFGAQVDGDEVAVEQEDAA